MIISQNWMNIQQASDQAAVFINGLPIVLFASWDCSLLMRSHIIKIIQKWL